MAGTYNFPTQFRLDTFQSRSITFLDEIDDPINLTGATIVMEFRRYRKSGILLRRMIIGSGLTVPAPATGQFIIASFTLDFPVGITFYDVKVTIAGVTATFLQGQLQVTQNVSQP